MSDPALIAALTFAALATFALAWGMSENERRSQAEESAGVLARKAAALEDTNDRLIEANQHLIRENAGLVVELSATQGEVEKLDAQVAKLLRVAQCRWELIQKQGEDIEVYEARIAELERAEEWDREAFGDQEMRRVAGEVELSDLSGDGRVSEQHYEAN